MARRYRRSSSGSENRLLYAVVALLAQIVLLALHFAMHGIKVFWTRKGPEIKAWIQKKVFHANK